MTQLLRHIREAIKAHYQTTGIAKPKNSSLFLTVVNKVIDHLDDETETDIQGIVQNSLRELLNEEAEVYHEVDILFNNVTKAAQTQTNDDAKKIEPYLLEFAEKAINRRTEIGEEAYLAYLSETAKNIKRGLSHMPEDIIRTADRATNTPQPTPIEKQITFIASIEPFSFDIKNLISINLPLKDEITDFTSAIEDAESVLSDFENIMQTTERGEIIDTSEDYGFFDLATDYIRNSFSIAWERHIAKNEAIRKSTSAAAKKKNAPLDEWKEEARVLCRTEWRSGSSRHHNKIVQTLMIQERFKSTPSGKYEAKDILMRVLAKVADEPEFKGRNLKYGMINKKIGCYLRA